MSDKVKQFRDKNPMLDFLAGFIPGVGEAQDAHDFYYAAKKGDVMQAGLSSLGLLLPGLTGNQIKKFIGVLGELSPALKAKGWKLANDGKSFISPNGVSFMRNSEGKLMSEESLANEIKAKYIKPRNIAKEKAQKQLLKSQQKALDELDDLGFKDFHPQIWFKERGYLKGNKGSATQEDVNTWMSNMPMFLETAKELLSKKQLFFDKNTRQWIGVFKDGIKPINPTEYIVANTSNFKNSKLLWDGDTYYSGMGVDDYDKLLSNGGLSALNWGTTTRTYAEDIADAKKGPVISSLVGVNTQQHNFLPYKGNVRPDPSNYSAQGRPVGADVNNKTKEFLGEPLKGTVNIPEIYTRESKSQGLASKWRIFGTNTQVKALRGNNGNFDLTNPNIYKGLLPFIMGSTLYKTYKTNKEEK